MAATILANIKQDIKVESRGMVVLFPEPYNPKAVAIAAKHGNVNKLKTANEYTPAGDNVPFAARTCARPSSSEPNKTANVPTTSSFATKPVNEATVSFQPSALIAHPNG
jgi:protein-tyrosine phosphatase